MAGVGKSSPEKGVTGTKARRDGWGGGESERRLTLKKSSDLVTCFSVGELGRVCH